MYNEEGESVWERSLDSFGRIKEISKGSNSSCPFMYQGQYYDKEINLAYNRFRYYCPEDGRYISRDPIGLVSGEFGLYNYVGDPNGWVDNMGLAGNSYHKKIQQLREGDAGTIVYVKNKKQADKLLNDAFPNYQKVRGMGNQPLAKQNRHKIPNKQKRFEDTGQAYHKDYAMDPKTGRVVGHGPGKATHYHPHIDINRGTNGVKDIVHIVIKP